MSWNNSESRVREKSTATAHPSLALVKYWGKQNEKLNTPATPSLAVTLSGLTTKTTVILAKNETDSVILDGNPTDPNRYLAFFDACRLVIGTSDRFHVESSNSFSTAAGLASSASGFAAMAWAIFGLYEESPDPGKVSSAARQGSASAARSVYSGFTTLPAGSRQAIPLKPADFWPEFRIIACEVSTGKKPVSSREAMNLARDTSPYYQQWVQDAPGVYARALDALNKKDIEALGEASRSSYLKMFSTMFSSSPPVFYWLPESTALIRFAGELRESGIGVWETMDAGPQVKLLCLNKQVQNITSALKEAFPRLKYTVCSPGPGTRLENDS